MGDEDTRFAADEVAEDRPSSEAARGVDQRFATVLRTTPSGIIITRARDGAIVDVNDAFVRVLGWSREELVGRTTAEVGLYPDPDARARIYEELGRTGSVATMDARARHKSGATRDFRLTAGTVDVAGERCAIGFWEDVTELRRMDAALHERESELGAMFDAAPIGIAQADPRTLRLLRVNDRLCLIIGYTAEELRSMCISDITHPDDRAADLARFAGIDRGESPPASFEKRYLRKDGRVVWARVNLRVLRDERGRATKAIATIEDITSRRAEEAALRLQTSALEAAANAIVITDRNGIVQWVNEAFSRLTGFTAEDVLGSSPRLLRSGVQGNDFYREMWDAILAGRTWRGELVNRRKDGGLYDEDMTITPVRDERGTVTHFVAIKQDVTDRKRHAEALVEAEERHRLALDATELGTWRHDIGEDQFRLDERAQGHFGLDRASVHGQEMLGRVHRDDIERVRAAIAGAHSPLGPGRALVEHRVVMPSGEERSVSVHVQVHFTGVGAARVPRFAIATSQDITDVKKGAHALRESEDRYRALVDNLDDLMFSVDLAGVVTFVSRSITRFGYAPSDVVGHAMVDFIHPEDRSVALRDFGSRLSGGTSGGPYEIRWLDASGKVRFLRATTRALEVGDRVVGLTGLASDVTRQRETEEQLRAAQRMEAIGRLAGGVAHDFNNMLSVILSYTELAVTDLREGDPLRTDLQEVAAAARRAEGLTRQLLAFSRRQVLEPEPLHLGELAGGLSKMLRRLIGEDVDLKVATVDSLFVTKVDRGQTEQVVMNLAVNARDAMPGGGELRIATGNATLDERQAAALEVPPGQYVELTVSDTGCGMSPRLTARIFEPFFTTKEVGKGTGLGLSMVHGIVKQSGGGISVETAPGRGTAFHVFLPRYLGSPASMSTQPGVLREMRGAETILVVEDESALRNVAKRILSSAGYKVYAAANAGEALLLCEELGSQIALVLTDVVMPGMNGRELVERLAPLRPSAKVVFMSGYTDELLEHHGVLGQRFLRKPFDRGTLAGKVRGALDEA